MCVILKVNYINSLSKCNCLMTIFHARYLYCNSFTADMLYTKLHFFKFNIRNVWLVFDILILLFFPRDGWPVFFPSFLVTKKFIYLMTKTNRYETFSNHGSGCYIKTWEVFHLTHEVPVLPSYRNQSIDLHSIWLLCEGNTGT